MCSPIFTATQFTVVRTWKKPRYPLADQWIKKTWCISTIEYYSAIKRNKSESVELRMKLESVYYLENFFIGI